MGPRIVYIQNDGGLDHNQSKYVLIKGFVTKSVPPNTPTHYQKLSKPTFIRNSNPNHLVNPGALCWHYPCTRRPRPLHWNNIIEGRAHDGIHSAVGELTSVQIFRKKNTALAVRLLTLEVVKKRSVARCMR